MQTNTTIVKTEIVTTGYSTDHPISHPQNIIDSTTLSSTNEPTKVGFVTDSLSHQHHIAATVIFKPLEAKFYQDTDLRGEKSLYCKIKLGWHSAKTVIANNKGDHPTWRDVIVMKRKHGEQYAKLKLKDKDSVILHDRIGQAKINLEEVAALNKITQWYSLHKGDKIIGEILLDIEHIRD